MLAIRLMWLEVPLTALHDLWCSWLLPLAIRRHRHDFMQQRKVRMPARQASQGCAALSVQYSIAPTSFGTSSPLTEPFRQPISSALAAKGGRSCYVRCETGHLRDRGRFNSGHEIFAIKLRHQNTLLIHYLTLHPFRTQVKTTFGSKRTSNSSSSLIDMIPSTGRPSSALGNLECR